MFKLAVSHRETANLGNPMTEETLVPVWPSWHDLYGLSQSQLGAITWALVKDREADRVVECPARRLED